MNFTMETLNVQDFIFTVRKNDYELIPITMYLSTSSPSTKVICDASMNKMKCKAPGYDTIAIELKLKDQTVELYGGYNEEGLNFIQEHSKYLLEISSNFTPILGDKILGSFLMEWPSSVTLQEPQEQVREAVIPSNYESCDESENCDLLKRENGVKFGNNGTVEFTMANLDKEKEFKLLHSFGYFSPIFTLNDSFICSKYSTKITFNNLGFILFKRDGEKIDIETGSLTRENLPILKESNVQFYFYNNFIYRTFFDPQNHFQLYTFKLSDGNGGNVLSIKIDYKSSVQRCNGIVKLIVRNGVKLLFPKSITSSTTFNKPAISTPSSNTNKTNETTTKAADKTETASFPLWAIIVISCVGVFILICGLILLICCIIKKRKNKSPKKTENLSISEMERRMLAKKKKSKNDDDKNNIPTVICDTPIIDFPKPKKSNDEVPKLDNQNNAVEKEIVKKKEEEKSYEKPPRFNPEFVKSLLPPGACIPSKYYEENPIKDETIDYGSLARNFTLTDGFWALFPFIRVNPNNDYLLQYNPFFQYQFVIRDLSLPENKVFHKFGARLFEPVDEEIVSPEDGTEPPKELIPVVVRTFILCKDPPAIECIVHGRYPGFFTNMLDCKSCDTNRRPRFFDEDQLSRLSQCLREVPLGHHINTVVGNDRKFLFDKTGGKYPIKTIFVVKGSEQIVPLNLQYGKQFCTSKWF
uniref:CUB domain-containing protein n=1 Tax=Panagrolaimus davidi TaxID=227884 RepID=A0A914PGX8_9BILA